MSRMWRREVPILGAGLVLCFGVVVSGHGTGSSAAATPSGQAAASTGRAIVELATPSLPSGRSDAARRAWRRERGRAADILTRVAERNGLSVTGRIPETGQLTVKLGEGGVEALRRRLADDPRVHRVTADRVLEIRSTPNDPGFGRQWNLVRSQGPAAWNLSKGVGAEVAVIDTGAYTSHPDLAGRIVARINCGSFGCSGTNVADSDGHGTHVAGLACANSANGYGIASLGFDCNLAIIRFDFTCSGAAHAVVRAGNRRSDVINMSFGGPCSSMTGELAYALARGSVLVAAGANSPNPNPSSNYPAQWVQPRGTGPSLGFNRGLVVTSAKASGSRSSFAQGDTGVSVSAYGSQSNSVSGGQQGILSTWINGSGSCPSCRTSVGGSSLFAYLVGTSMAAPQVSGLAALARSAWPGIAPSQVARLIKINARHCGRYYGGGLGWGVINAERTINSVLGRDLTAPSSRVKRRKGKKAKRVRKRKGVWMLKVPRADPGLLGCDRIARSSGVREIYVFVSRNGKRYRQLKQTTRKTIRFKPKKKGKYRFIARALDWAGNAEPWPSRADFKLKVKRVTKKQKARR